MDAAQRLILAGDLFGGLPQGKTVKAVDQQRGDGSGPGRFFKKTAARGKVKPRAVRGRSPCCVIKALQNLHIAGAP
ncbi:hypothetical protein [Tabrizicola fusiformis]|uniref:hypothetical protein n=1 Tax=Tabrizicola sp. SY72 TaxID=2741673 RepID=UPI001572F1D8|nr:hypothetical protein [Tabrizicola sp. SY72]NTT87381.1 hypothetical protein [Tabrizicola sp. SY72]